MKLIALFGILLFICYPIGGILSRGPLGVWAWGIAFYIAIKAIEIIFANEKK